MMDHLEPEVVDEIIERLVRDLEIVRMSEKLSTVLSSAFGYRFSHKHTFFRFRVRIPVAGMQQGVILYADMGAN